MLPSVNYIIHALSGNITNISVPFRHRILNITKTQLKRPEVQISILYSTNKDDRDEKNIFVNKKEKVSKAMRAYLERAAQHDQFMKQQHLEYEVGKRHLANMMGEDPETFTQSDIDKAIEYLFPSGLFEPKARPLMKPPEEVFPQRKAAEFDESGRPFHYLFYTGKPNFYNLLYNVVNHMHSLNDFEDKMIRKHIKPDANQTMDLSGTEWIPKEQLETSLVEPLHDSQYASFVVAMDRLMEHPYSYRAKDFLEHYRKPLMSQTKTYEIPKPGYDAEGRAFITMTDCLRKSSRGEVTLRSPGTGKVTINGQGIDYFEDIQPREQVEFLWVASPHGENEASGCKSPCRSLARTTILLTYKKPLLSHLQHSWDKLEVNPPRSESPKC